MKKKKLKFNTLYEKNLEIKRQLFKIANDYYVLSVISNDIKSLELIDKAINKIADMKLDLDKIYEIIKGELK